MRIVESVKYKYGQITNVSFDSEEESILLTNKNNDLILIP